MRKASPCDWQAEQELNEVGFQLEDVSARLEEADNIGSTQVIQIVHHRRSQDFVCGGALFYHPAKTPKNWLLLWLGVHLVSCGGALTHFSCKLGLKKKFFTALGGAGAPTAPPGYAYVVHLITCIKRIVDYSLPCVSNSNSPDVGGF